MNYAPFASFGGWSGAVNAAVADGEPGRGVRLPVVHELTGDLGRGRHARQDRLQPVPDVPLQQHPALDRRRAQRGRRRPTTLAPSRPASRTPTWCSTCASRRPSATSRTCSTRRVVAVPRGRARRGRHRAGHHRWLERHHRRGRQGPAARCVHRQPWRRSASVDRPRHAPGVHDARRVYVRRRRPGGCSSGRPSSSSCACRCSP